MTCSLNITYATTTEMFMTTFRVLSCEARNETTKAKEYMKAAASSAYATNQGAGDYMSACAKVHCQLRGWA